MADSNFERMIKMAQEVFDAQNDANQIQVDEDVIHHLIKLHPAAVTELDYSEGPVVWILLIPTTEDIMQDFLQHKINEQDILNKTTPGGNYNAVYLCSAMVLPEHQQSGLATSLTLQAIKEIQQTNSIKCLFYWPFTEAGEKLAEKIAQLSGLVLYKRSN